MLADITARMIFQIGGRDEETDRRRDRRVEPRPAQQPLSTDLANIVNTATSAINPRHPSDLVCPARHLQL